MRKLKIIVTSIAALACAIAPAHAAQIVYDPTNYAQNVLTAARALEEIHNQITQIEQQAKMLTKNPLQLSPALMASIKQAHDLFKTAQGIAFDAQRVSDDIKTLYPETWDKFDLKDILARSDQWMSQDRANLDQAMHAEADAVAAIEATGGRIDAAMGASADSDGQTGAVQASNQLLGIQASQLAQIEALLVVQSRELSNARLEQEANAARAREIQHRAFPTSQAGDLTPAHSAF